jgi:hypothetical protein
MDDLGNLRMRTTLAFRVIFRTVTAGATPAFEFWPVYAVGWHNSHADPRRSTNAALLK